MHSASANTFRLSRDSSLLAIGNSKKRFVLRPMRLRFPSACSFFHAHKKCSTSGTWFTNPSATLSRCWLCCTSDCSCRWDISKSTHGHPDHLRHRRPDLPLLSCDLSQEHEEAGGPCSRSCRKRQ